MFRSFIFFLSLISLTAEAKTFRFRLVEDMGTLDWNYGEINPEIAYQLMEGLFTADHKGNPMPAAAEKFVWNEEKTKITFFLLKGLRWSDGKNLCAQEFVDSWQRLQSKSFASPYAHYAHVIKKAEAKSCDTLSVEFTRSAPEFPALLTHYVFFPIRLDAVEKNPKLFATGKDIPVNGPFKIEQWDREQKMVLAQNHLYRGKRGTINRVEILFLPEDHTALALFEKKKLDWIKEVPVLSRSRGWERNREFKIFPAAIVYYLGLNAEKSALLKDNNLRLALSGALQRDALPNVLGGEVSGQANWIPSNLRVGAPVPAAKANFQDAKIRLQEAVKKGEMDLVLRVYNKPAHRLLAEWVQGQWLKAFSVKIPIEVQEAKVYWKEISANPAPIFLSGVTAPFFHSRAFLQEFLSTSTANWTAWKSAEYDGLVAKNHFGAAEALLLKEGRVIPVYSRGNAALVQKKWRGFWINPLGQIFLKELR